MSEFFLVPPGWGVGFGRPLFLLPGSGVSVAGPGTGYECGDLVSSDTEETLAIAPDSI